MSNKTSQMAIEKAISLCKSGILPTAQAKHISSLILHSEEKKFFIEKINELFDLYDKSPKLYETENNEIAEKKVLFHFFSSEWDWYIVEIDKNDNLAFGFVNGWEGEWGYISLEELVNTQGIQLDLHFEPKAFKEIKTK